MALPSLTADLAREAPHASSIAELDPGHVHYELTGPGDGTPLVLIHGLTSPMFVWDPVVAPLAAAGHRVLRYDLYGRGLSARPRDRAYDLALFETQLELLLQHGDLVGPVHLVAFSWGCGMAATYAASRRDTVSRLTLLAPGGLPGSRHDASLTALRAPVVGELLAATVGLSGLREDVRRCFASPDEHTWFAERFEQQLAFDGYRAAFLDTLRRCPRTFEAAYAALGRTALPVRLLWGELDAKVPFARHERFLQLVPQAELRSLGPTGHAAQIEAPAAFVSACLD